MTHFNGWTALRVTGWGLLGGNRAIALHDSLFTAALPHLDSSQSTQAGRKSLPALHRDKQTRRGSQRHWVANLAVWASLQECPVHSAHLQITQQHSRVHVPSFGRHLASNVENWDFFETLRIFCETSRNTWKSHEIHSKWTLTLATIMSYITLNVESRRLLPELLLYPVSKGTAISGGPASGKELNWSNTHAV